MNEGPPGAGQEGEQCSVSDVAADYISNLLEHLDMLGNTRFHTIHNHPFARDVR